MKKTCIIGAGGFGKEVFTIIKQNLMCYTSRHYWMEDYVCFMVDDEYYNESEIFGVKVIPKSEFDPYKYNLVVAIGDPVERKNIIESLPDDVSFTSIVHHTAIMGDLVEIGEGSIITAGVIVTCDVKIGKHAHLNLHTTIGHDCVIGDYFTTAPAVNISGKCKIGDCVYFGTTSAIREKLTVVDNVTVGMGGIVVKDVLESGVYIGNPLKKLK